MNPITAPNGREEELAVPTPAQLAAWLQLIYFRRRLAAAPNPAAPKPALLSVLVHTTESEGFHA